MKSAVLLTSVSVALFSGCAFKDKAQEAGSGLGPSIPPLSITLSWQEGEEGARGERSNKRRLRKTPDQLFWTWDAPLQLPPLVPAAMDLRFDVYASADRLRGLTVEDVVIEGRRGRGDAGGGFDERFRPLRRAPTLEVGPSAVQEGVSFAKVRVEDLASLFSEREQGVLEIRVSVRDASGNWISRYLGSLRTPPSLISVKQMRLDEFEAGGRTLDREIKRIRTESGQLDMLQIVEVKNGADGPVEVDFPNRLENAALATRVETFEYADSGCDYEIRHTDEERSLTERVYLAALKSLDAEVSFIGANPDARTVQTLRLEIGETAWVGIYGKGQNLPALIDNGRTRQELSRTQIQGRCYWQCPHRWQSAWWTRSENFNHPHYVECRACESGDLDACGRCKANDPWPTMRPWNYCEGPWRQVRQGLQVDLGTRTYPVALRISAEDNVLRMRWPEAAEVREVKWPHPSVGYMD